MRHALIGFVGMFLAGGAFAEGIPSEVRLSGGEDVSALCAELGDEEGAAAARAAIYSMRLPASSFVLLAYDGHRARISIDASRGFRAKDGSYELVLHDLGGSTRAKTGGLDMAIPASATEAASIAKGHRAGTIGLTLWFRVAKRPDDVPVCATVHTTTGEGTRLAIEPLAFLLSQGTERIASGETSEWADLRDAAEKSAGEPRVTVSTPTHTKTGAKASDSLHRAISDLAPTLETCYRDGLVDAPDLRGSLVVGISVTESGRISEARAEIDGLGSANVVACVVSELKSTRLPRGSDGRWSVPMKFRVARP
jgi:hypothetical protein